MTHVLGKRLKELIEDADREKALKAVTNAAAKEKGKAIEVVKKKAQASKKARQLVEADSLNLAQANQIIDLKAALKACKNKWYNEDFADAEKSAKLVIHQARFHGFGEGWLVVLQAMGVPEDFPLRNPT